MHVCVKEICMQFEIDLIEFLKIRFLSYLTDLRFNSKIAQAETITSSVRFRFKRGRNKQEKIYTM